jgi:hypothetical protein
LVALFVLAGIGIGLGAYNAGYDNGLTAQPGSVVQVVRYVGGPGFGFFPGFIIFPLVFFAIFAFARGRRHWHGGPWNHEGRSHIEDRFDQWHRERHDEQIANH